MRRVLPGINLSLAEAVLDVSEASAALPAQLRPDLTGERWQDLEAEIDRACATGDRDGALHAIETWKERTLGVLWALHQGAEVGARG